MASLLVTYSDSSEEEKEDDNSKDLESNPRKRKQKELTQVGEDIIDENAGKPNKRLPSVPLDIQNMFNEEECDSIQDDASEHDGRIRSFAHERGNWASYVFIPASCADGLQDLASNLMENLAPHAELKVIEDFHLSLSKTFVLRHHWIDSFVAVLRDHLLTSKSFVCELGELETYCNDEKTRTFIGFEVCAGVEKLKNLTKEVDKCLDQFKLPKYYEKPSFHISVAWAIGDVSAILKSAACQQILKDTLEEELDVSPHISVLDVKEISCKVGNRLYKLSSASR